MSKERLMNPLFLWCSAGQPAPSPSLSTTAAAGGSGVLGALSRPDWGLRRAAADSLRATVLLLGTAMEVGAWVYIRQQANKCRN